MVMSVAPAMASGHNQSETPVQGSVPGPHGSLVMGSGSCRITIVVVVGTIEVEVSVVASVVVVGGAAVVVGPGAAVPVVVVVDSTTVELVVEETAELVVVELGEDVGGVVLEVVESGCVVDGVSPSVQSNVNVVSATLSRCRYKRTVPLIGPSSCQLPFPGSSHATCSPATRISMGAPLGMMVQVSLSMTPVQSRTVADAVAANGRRRSEMSPMVTMMCPIVRFMLTPRSMPLFQGPFYLWPVCRPPYGDD